MPEEVDPIWSCIREELRRDTPDLKFHIWLDPLEPAAVRGKTLYVAAPEHIRGSVAERYLPLLRRAAVRHLGASAVVEIVAPGWQPDQLPAADPAARSHRSSLSPKYTFEQFVIGAGNRLAHAAALAAAELPGQAYNPLFLHGLPGLGKTHLLHAIGNYVNRYGTGLSVRYATVEEFTAEFVEAVRRQRTSAFRESFRGADVVLIDDVQFLARKERTREEFFHTFNALFASGRQLVLTSDRAPQELQELEARLEERFRSGLVVELEPPGFEVRRAILAKRARLDGVSVNDAVVAEIAGLVTSSVRALEGALIRVVAYASLREQEPTPTLVRHVLSGLGPKPQAAYGLAEIVEATAREFRVDPQQVLARSRRPPVAQARQVAMFLARELTDHSLPEIGRGIGGRNHTTVLHAVNSVTASLGNDPSVRKAVYNLRRHLKPPQ
ncbi:MAG TPA: chromosomal replication initiator protein DnaA [Thermoleophilaceae bacterium]|nr:chromosomal replication initiator protein DnaA [Thermoleophilaceae bacterium]